MSPAYNKLVTAFTVPIFDDNRSFIGTLEVLTDVGLLLDNIDDIVVGNSGYRYILGLTETIIAHKNTELIKAEQNNQTLAKTDKSFTYLADFKKMAVSIDWPSVGFYEYGGISKIASYATMKTTDRTIVINAPLHEFMGTVYKLRKRLLMIGAQY